MQIPSEIQKIIDRIYLEVEQIEAEATFGLNILRRVMSKFPENAILLQYFAYLNALLFFTTTARQQIQNMVNVFSEANLSLDVIQETGEDLGILLGKAIESKLRVEKIVNFLRELP
ncbi:hypothetical protein PMG71_21675 [Roseofilum sp. BLCC_M154]|uniref:Specificity determinant for HsdM and HsdR n=1 Tax=Roseofilum acuticapitatum BLCC-M154 TaxID=3022444 RepID=A0ABT7AYU4_9CYAN|nr:hypothetical protein [Roseofilum acuticapitatum]MDJ1172045.1 hypothetical protein [Roseofilum acuticapitatum BLCC-M154]